MASRDSHHGFNILTVLKTRSGYRILVDQKDRSHYRRALNFRIVYNSDNSTDEHNKLDSGRF